MGLVRCLQEGARARQETGGTLRPGTDRALCCTERPKPGRLRHEPVPMAARVSARAAVRRVSRGHPCRAGLAPRPALQVHRNRPVPGRAARHPEGAGQLVRARRADSARSGALRGRAVPGRGGHHGRARRRGRRTLARQSETRIAAGSKVTPMTRLLLILMAAANVGCANLAHAAANEARSDRAASCPGNGEPMTVGYFDHTAAWYRGHPRFRAEQSLPHVWSTANPGALVVLYSDIAANRTEDVLQAAAIEALRRNMETRSADIADYLEAAAKNGKVKVLLQLPPDLVARWADEPSMRDLLGEYVSRWSRYPAL